MILLALKCEISSFLEIPLHPWVETQGILENKKPAEAVLYFRATGTIITFIGLIC